MTSQTTTYSIYKHVQPQSAYSASITSTHTQQIDGACSSSNARYRNTDIAIEGHKRQIKQLKENHTHHSYNQQTLMFKTGEQCSRETKRGRHEQ